jgi:hypothetical protein
MCHEPDPGRRGRRPVEVEESIRGGGRSRRRGNSAGIRRPRARADGNGRRWRPARVRPADDRGASGAGSGRGGISRSPRGGRRFASTCGRSGGNPAVLLRGGRERDLGRQNSSNASPRAPDEVGRGDGAHPPGGPPSVVPPYDLAAALRATGACPAVARSARPTCARARPAPPPSAPIHVMPDRVTSCPCAAGALMCSRRMWRAAGALDAQPGRPDVQTERDRAARCARTTLVCRSRAPNVDGSRTTEGGLGDW